MKKTLLILGVVLLAGAGLNAKKLIRFVTPIDLYAKNPIGGACIHVVNTGYCLSASWQTGGSGFQASLIGSNSVPYDLFQDSSCTVPVYFN